LSARSDTSHTGSDSWIAAASEDPEQSRQAQYLAAQLYLKGDDAEAALREFSSYARRYPTPLDINMEALDAQDVLLQRMNGLEGARSAVWRSKVELHRRMGQQANERANFLAAQARLGLADIERQGFDSIRLNQPLKRSLKAKQKALSATVRAYQQVVGYGVTEFATAATYQIANMYVELGSSIMASERPARLSALELEQYEILLEEQAYPFEEQAIDLHQVNLERMWAGTIDAWTQRSLGALRILMPGRFDKNELQVAYVDTIH
jgi:hypothetical protein